MESPFSGQAAFVEVLDDGTDLGACSEAPQSLEVLPDGTEVIVIGDPQWAARFNHQQGDNDLGFAGTCGLVSCEQVLRQAGLEVTENDVVRYACDHGLCVTDAHPQMNGGTTVMDQARLLSNLGIPAHPEILDSSEDLASRLEGGQHVILAVNAGELWSDPGAYGTGDANHSILATGVARDAQTGELVGFYVNDSGTGESARFIPVEDLHAAWLDSGGLAVTTDGSVCSLGSAETRPPQLDGDGRLS